MHIEVWDEITCKNELARRLQHAKEARRDLEDEWTICERAVFGTSGFASPANLSISYESQAQTGLTGVDNSSTNIGSNYVFKNLRFIHSQMSANPPSVIPRPTSNDMDDRRKADASDRLIRYGLRQYKFQERFDEATFPGLVRGTTIVKTLHDADLGDIIEFNEQTGEILTEGDFAISTVSSWNFYIDPDAANWDEVIWVFEELYMHWEGACYKFGPEKKEILEQLRVNQGQQVGSNSGETYLRPKRYDSIKVYQYWEKGTPSNGMVGRFCYCTEDGTVLTPMRPNPHRFSPPRTEGAPQFARAKLPYHILTDIDVPGQVWGKSVVAYVAGLQDTLNRLDNVTMDGIQAHGIPRMILPEGAEVANNSITNSPWDVIKITGSQPPHFMEALPLSPTNNQMRMQLKQTIDDIMGVNEAMFGQQSREQSGFSMQYATNQGNMIRRRLFNKYVLLVESVYKDYLNVIRKYWVEPRTIQVLGKEKAFEAIDIKGTDIDGGFDLVVEYGASLSLDPTSRREEIITLMPMFEKAGMDIKPLLGMMKLNELDNMYDKTQMAADRQREIFDEMTARNIYIEPEEIQNHKDMLAFAYDYVMTSEYKYLPQDAKILITAHIKEREKLAAQGMQPAGTGEQPPGPLPGGIPAPMSEPAAPAAAPAMPPPAK